MFMIMCALPLILLMCGLPLFLVLLATVTSAIVFLGSMPPTAVPQIMFSSIGQFSLLAVPFFIFAGELMGRGGMARRLVRLPIALFSGVRGATPITTVGATTLYGSISGSTAATVAAIGPIFYPQLRQKGYDEKFSAGLITCAGYLDNIIPPSIAMILYCVAAEQSVVKLFYAGIIPGIVLAIIMAFYIFGYAWLKKIDAGSRPQIREILIAFKEGFWAIMMPVIVFGGIYGGMFTPTEAAGIACVYAILVTMFVHKEIQWQEFWKVAISSMYLTSQVFLIVALAGVFSWILTTSGLAGSAVVAIGDLNLPSWAILLVINLFLLVVGCVIDTASAILVLTPLLLPIATHINVDPIHFGIIIVTNLSIGTFTPPFGINIFVAQSIFNVPLKSIYRGLVPFILVAIVGLMIITYVPALSLWLLGK
ncbi:TRAP transporter large permease [Agrobacterium salinitolerans]|uniref:TRAP transporter large permease n=1 Tax=Agrobacterium salinitolerans TaxID=1183413 RepID=UPI001574047E|nr:TRAP transporter large permease [Agrobacterium salinitolerans]NTA40266.1 TRAP transporter large permease [Agrobacterium salinitolerans]